MTQTQIRDLYNRKNATARAARQYSDPILKAALTNEAARLSAQLETEATARTRDLVIAAHSERQAWLVAIADAANKRAIIRSIASNR